MKKNFNFELVKHNDEAPVNAFICEIYDFDLHLHHDLEIIYLLKGEKIIQVNDESYHLKSGDFVFINSLELHKFEASYPDAIILIVQIDFEYCKKLHRDFKNMSFVCNSVFDELKNSSQVMRFKQYISEIIWELRIKSQGYDMAIKGLANLLLTSLYRDFEYSIKVSDLSDKKNIERLVRVIEYINNNFDKDISVHKIADKEEINYNYLSRYFKEKLKISLSDYIISVRLKKATLLLRNSEEKIIDIAYECGFSNVSSLNNQFKKLYKTTPTEYRKRFEKDAETNIESAENTEDENKYISALETILEHLPARNDKVLVNSNVHMQPHTKEAKEHNYGGYFDL